MTAYAIDINNRTVRVFDTVADAVHGASAGEQVCQPVQETGDGSVKTYPGLTLFAGKITHEQRNDASDRSKFLQDRFPTLTELFTKGERLAAEGPIVDGEVVDVSAESAPAHHEPESAEGLLAHLLDNARAVQRSLVDAVRRVEGYRLAAEEERAAQGGVDAQIAEVKAKYLRHLAASRARMRSAKSVLEAARIRKDMAEMTLRELEELDPLQKLKAGPGPAEARKLAAERELAGLIARLTESCRADLGRAKATAARITGLEHAEPADLNPRPGPSRRKPLPYRGRAAGEKRGRRSGREGKSFRFRPDMKANPALRNSRRHRSYQLILDNPGISYERYLEMGGQPADIGLALANGTLIMSG